MEEPDTMPDSLLDEAYMRPRPWRSSLAWATGCLILLGLRALACQALTAGWQKVFFDAPDAAVAQVYQPYRFVVVEDETGTDAEGQRSHGAEEGEVSLPTEVVASDEAAEDVDNAPGTGAHKPVVRVNRGMAGRHLISLTGVVESLKDPFGFSNLSVAALGAVSAKMWNGSLIVPSTCSPLSCSGSDTCPLPRLADIYVANALAEPSHASGRSTRHATRAHRSFGAGGPADLPPSSPLASCWCALVILPSPRKDVDGSAGAPNIASARSLAPNVADGLRVQAARDLIASGAPPRDLWKGIGHGGATAAAAAAWAALPSLKADASLSTAVVAAQRDLLGHLLGATLSTSLGSLSIHAVRGVFVGRQTPVERAAVADRQMHYGAARAVSFVAFLLSSRSLEEAAQWVLLSMVFLYLHSFLSMAEVRFALLRVSVSPRPSSYASLLLLELSVATVAAALFAALPRTSSIGWLLLVGARISLTLAVVESLHQIIQQLIVLHRASTLSAMPRDIALRVMSAAAAVVKLLARLAAALLLSPLHATLIALRAARAAARAAASAVLPKSDCRDARDRRSPDSAGAIRQDDPIPPEGTGVGAQAPFVRANASPGASPRPSMDAPPQRQAPRAGAAEIWADEDAGLLMAGAAGPGEQDGPNWEASGPFLFYWEVVAESLLLATQLVECMIAWLYCFKGPGGSLRAIGRLLLGLFILVQASSVGNNIYRLVRLVSRYVTSMRNLTQAFEDVSAEDMPEGEECAICKDTMAAAKKLPCGHMFHVACLRMWLDQSGSQQFTCPLCRHPLHRPVAEPGEGNGNAAPSSVLGALLWDVVGNDEAHDTGGLGIDPEEERRLRQEFPIIFVATESIDALLTFAFEAMRTAWGAVLAVVIAAVVSILNLLGVHVQIEIGLGEHRDMVSDSDDDLGGSGMREAAAEMLHVGRRSPERRRRRRNVEAPGSVEGSNRGSIDVPDAVEALWAERVRAASPAASALRAREVSWGRGEMLAGTAAEARRSRIGQAVRSGASWVSSVVRRRRRDRAATAGDASEDPADHGGPVPSDYGRVSDIASEEAVWEEGRFFGGAPGGRRRRGGADGGTRGSASGRDDGWAWSSDESVCGPER